jgi:hypothetical protein
LQAQSVWSDSSPQPAISAAVHNNPQVVVRQINIGVASWTGQPAAAGSSVP